MEISLFTKCLFEFIGTLVLVLLGDGVVASTVLKRSKGFDGGWIVITIAWGLAVMCGVLIAGPYSGAHLNPAVSVGLAVAGSFPWAYVPGYVAAQLLGGFCGAVVVYLYYKDHFDATDDPAAKLGVFCTMPAIMDKPRNLFCEVVGTFLLVFVILAIGNEQNTPEIGMGSLGSLPVTMLIMEVSMSLPTMHFSWSERVRAAEDSRSIAWTPARARSKMSSAESPSWQVEMPAATHLLRSLPFISTRCPCAVMPFIEATSSSDSSRSGSSART